MTHEWKCPKCQAWTPAVRLDAHVEACDRCSGKRPAICEYRRVRDSNVIQRLLIRLAQAAGLQLAPPAPSGPPPDARLYFECHVTIEPVFEEERAQVNDLARSFGFHLAELLMQKRKADTPERSKHDTFMTGRSKNYNDLFRRMRLLKTALNRAGYAVFRAKIEDTLFDTKYGDKLP